jgi:hypothetical protein
VIELAIIPTTAIRLPERKDRDPSLVRERFHRAAEAVADWRQ